MCDFSITDDDEYLFTTDVLLKKDYMDNWWGKFVVAEHHANIAHEKGEEYADIEELITLDGSDDDGTSRRSKNYHEFNENHDIRIPIELEKGLMFANTRVFKRAIKWYDVQHVFDFKYKYNDRMRVNAVFKEQDCDWRIYASFDMKKESIQTKAFKPDYQCGNQYENTRADVEYIATEYMSSFKDDPALTHMHCNKG